MPIQNLGPVGIGNAPTPTVTFRNTAGVITDPTAVFCRYLPPGGTKVTLTYGTDPALIKIATGVYGVVLSLTAAGIWIGRFWSTGTVTAGVDWSITVEPSPLYP